MPAPPPLFYAPSENIQEDTIVLPGDEARHAARVLRLKPGEMVIVVDGLGNAFRGAIRSLTAAKATVSVLSQQRNFGEPAVKLTLAAGLSVGSKIDTVVQKATELGVVRIVPVVTDKSKVKIEDPKRARAKVTRLERVALAAMKQCRRSYRPEIAFPTTFTDFLAESDPDSLNLIFHPSPDAKRLSDVPVDNESRRITALVGPEAGFSDDEADQAIARDYLPVSLGERVLRTETAGPVVCALLMDRLGELR